jgi:hypothetical protein
MNAYTADNTVMATARNAVASGQEFFDPMLCGTHSTWRQRRLFECEMLLVRARAPHLQDMVPMLTRMRDSYLSENYSAAHKDRPNDCVFC